MAFDNTQYLFIVKILEKLKIQGIYLNIKKDSLQKANSQLKPKTKTKT